MTESTADTSIEDWRKELEIARSMTPQQRLQRAGELTDAARQKIVDEIECLFPDELKEQKRRRFIARVLPREDVVRAYGFDPNDLEW